MLYGSTTMKMGDVMTIYDGKETLKELAFEEFSDEQTDLHPIIKNNPEIILSEILKMRKFEAFHELSMISGAIDFLYVFEDGTLLIAEAKLSKNQEIKRKVVGQLLDYASDIASLDPKKFHETLKSIKQKHQPFLIEADFSQKLARGMKNKIIMAIVSDHIVGGLNRITSYLGGEMEKASIYLVEMRKYKNSDKMFLEVSIRTPDETPASLTANKTSIDEFSDTLAKRNHENEAKAISGVMKNIPAGWGLYAGQTEMVFYKENPDGKMRFGLNFNPYKDWMLLYGRENDYERIKNLFEQEDVQKRQKTTEIFSVVKIKYNTLTSDKIFEIMKKLDTL